MRRVSVTLEFVLEMMCEKEKIESETLWGGYENSVLTSSCTAIAFACCPVAVYISASRLLISSVVLSSGPQTLLKL